MFWHPRGWALYRIIENYLRDRLAAAGYQEVRSPQLYQRKMWDRSGHMAHYGDNIYQIDGEDMLLKPMNCPAHVAIFNADTVSHRQLPMRLAEFGCCHRKEPSGSLHGIMRVRQFVQDDAHIFCQRDQIEAEIAAFCNLLREVYRDFGFSDISVAISLRPDNRAGDDALWDESEASLIRVVEALGLPFRLLPGEGAFYGPKLEFALRDSMGREWQCGTAQLDFILPERLGARYAAADGREAVPVMIHRAIIGSFERFIGILLEHHGGDLPNWLAPVQAVIIPIRPDHLAYADELAGQLQQRGVRVSVEREDEFLNQRVKRHAGLVPAIVVVGDQEEQQNMMAVRYRNAKPVGLDLQGLLDILV